MNHRLVEGQHGITGIELVCSVQNLLRFEHEPASQDDQCLDSKRIGISRISSDCGINQRRRLGDSPGLKKLRGSPKIRVFRAAAGLGSAGRIRWFPFHVNCMLFKPRWFVQKSAPTRGGLFSTSSKTAAEGVPSGARDRGGLGFLKQFAPAILSGRARATASSVHRSS